jgi:hypothetical protein
MTTPEIQSHQQAPLPTIEGVAEHVRSLEGFKTASATDRAERFAISLLRLGMRVPGWSAVRKHIGHTGAAQQIGAGVEAARKKFAQEIEIRGAFTSHEIDEQLVPQFNDLLRHAVELAAAKQQGEVVGLKTRVGKLSEELLEARLAVEKSEHAASELRRQIEQLETQALADRKSHEAAIQAVVLNHAAVLQNEREIANDLEKQRASELAKLIAERDLDASRHITITGFQNQKIEELERLLKLSEEQLKRVRRGSKSNRQANRE